MIDISDKPREEPGVLFYMVKPKSGVTGVLGDVILQSNIGFAGKA